MFKKIKEKYIGNKAFYIAVLTVAIPLMFQQLITSSVNLIDNLMVGQLGDAAIGGVAAINRFYLIAQFGIIGINSAAAIFIAQYYGAKNERFMKESFRTAIIFSFLVVGCFFIIGLLFPNTIISFFATDADIIKMGEEYISVAIWTFLPLALTISTSSAMRAVGDVKTPLVVSVIAVLTNTFLNYCLIFGNFGFPALGVKGAALATFIARMVEAGLLLAALKIGDYGFKTKIHRIFKVSKDLVKRLLHKAAPLSMNEVLWSTGMAMLFKFYATRGTEVMSGYSIASTTSDLFFVLFGGMSAACTVLVSQRLGANKLDEGRENGYKIIGFGFMLSLVFGVVMFGSSFIVPNLYNVSAQAYQVAGDTIRVMSCLFWVYMCNASCYFVIRAGGDTKSTFYMDSVYMWTINIPIVALVTYLTDLPIIQLYIIGQCTDFIKVYISFKLLNKENWVRNITSISPDV